MRVQGRGIIEFIGNSSFLSIASILCSATAAA
jgi:hypothetical protein